MHLLEGISDGEWNKFYGRGIVVDQPIQLEKNWQMVFLCLWWGEITFHFSNSNNRIPISTKFELLVGFFWISQKVFRNLN